MVFRKLRWLSAAVLAAAAVVATPGLSFAETTILVQEVGGAFTQSYTLATLPASFNTTNFTNVQITVGTSSLGQPSEGRPGHTLSTTLVALAGPNFTPNSGLSITVTDNGFLNANAKVGESTDGFFVGNVGTTAGFAFTTNTGTTKIADTDPLNPNPKLKEYSAIASATPLVAGSAPFVSPAPLTPNVSGIPHQFSIQQLLEFRVTSITDASASFTASVSNSVNTVPQAAVPAPPAILLALAAVPALGLRRAIRKKA